MNDIEEIVQNTNIVEFVKELVKTDFKSENDYSQKCILLRSKYKLCPNKPQLRKVYHQLLSENAIEKNDSFIQFSMKKKTRSHSGVTVITILTSPKPKYTNYKGEEVEQSFTCGENCAYCPNEPEVRIDLVITHVNSSKFSFNVSTQDDIHLIRVLNYIIYKGNEYKVYNCCKFTESTFMIEMERDYSPFPFKEGDEIIGVKIAQPRSYLSTEPAVLRANRNNFDPILQIYDRADALMNCGHVIDKIEVLVLGGTWDHYPIGYQDEFIRDIYHSINTLSRRNVDVKLPLEKEIHFAQYSQHRIIGLTLETRPDCVTLKRVKRYRKYNVTRLQLGIQHIDNDILDAIQRGCHTEDTIQANNLWKQNGGKTDFHIMPDLPCSSVEKDIKMFNELFGVNSIKEVSPRYFKYDLKRPDLQADQLKIYPCSVVDWTQIKEWYENGTYKPYSENKEDLIQVLTVVLKGIFPWMRINRIIRDIPNQNIIGGNTDVNLRQKLDHIKSKCIRSREVKNNIENIDKAELFIREYNGIDSTEFFISFESPDQEILYGFLRLRINHTNDNLIYNELNGCAFIRELHVYGTIVKHHTKNHKSVQHMGFGKRLIKEAENIARISGINKVAIIAGVGVREYYENVGYQLVKDYMIKELEEEKYINCPQMIDIDIYDVLILFLAFIGIMVCVHSLP